jgi:hypothetical protein
MTEDTNVIHAGQKVNVVPVADETEMKKAVIGNHGEVEEGKEKVDLDIIKKLVVEGLMMESIFKVGDEDIVVTTSKAWKRGSMGNMEVGIMER